MVTEQEPQNSTEVKIATTGCQYCAVGCGYNAVLVSDRADGEDGKLEKFNSSILTPAMQNQIRYQGQEYTKVAVRPDPLCNLNQGNHSVRGGSQGANLVTSKGQDRSTKERLKSPLVRLSDGKLHEITWSSLNRIMAQLLAKATSLSAVDQENKQPLTKLRVGNPSGLGVKIYEYQYFENTYAATKLFYNALGTPNVAYHDRPSSAGSSPGMNDVGFGDPHRFSYQELQKSDVVFFAGTNPFENQTILFTENYLNSNAKWIVLDPRLTATAQFAKSDKGFFGVSKTRGIHLQPKALGADSLIFYAISRTLIERYGEILKENLDKREWGKVSQNLDDDRNSLLPDVDFKQMDKDDFDNIRRASRIADYEEFKKFLGVGDPNNKTYTLDNVVKKTDIERSYLEKVVESLAPNQDKTLKKVAFLYEKGLIWGFNYHNTSAIASLGLLLGAYSNEGSLVGRVGGHQKGWAEAKRNLGGIFENATDEGYPFQRSVTDTYTDKCLQSLPEGKQKIKVRHNIDVHVFGADPNLLPKQQSNDRVTLSNGVTTVAKPDVNLLWIIGNNYLGQTNDAQRKREVLEQRLRIGEDNPDEILRPDSIDEKEIIDKLSQRIDKEKGGLVIVHQEIFANPTTEFCDIVIPAAGWGEDNFCRNNAQRRLRLYERFQDMPLHSDDFQRIKNSSNQDPIAHIDNLEIFQHSPKPDWRIFRDIAKELGILCDRQIEEQTGQTSDHFTNALASEFNWQNSSQLADEMAQNSSKTKDIGAIYELNDSLKELGENIQTGEILHTFLGKNGGGESTWLANYYQPYDGDQIAQNEANNLEVATNGVFIPTSFISEENKIRGSVRKLLKKDTKLFFVKADWSEIEPQFQDNQIDASSDSAKMEVFLTNGRVNHVWNNMFHHLRNEYTSERYPEDLPGTVLELNPEWAIVREIANGQVIEVSNGDRSCKAIASLQDSVPYGGAFAMFSYPVRKDDSDHFGTGKPFVFDGYVNNLTDGYWDGINPIGALKYGRAVIRKAKNPHNNSDRWLYPDDFALSRLGPSFKQRNEILELSTNPPDEDDGDNGNGDNGDGEYPLNPTWENSIKNFFTQDDINCMKPRGMDLGDYQTVKDRAQDIARSVETGHMPPGENNRWSSEKVNAFKRWVANGAPRGEDTPTSPVDTQPGWSATTAPEAGSRYDDIWFISPQIGWAINSDGLILHTQDGGATWTQQFRTPAVGTRAVYLRCISFGNSQKGWVGTLTQDYRMFKTENGGTNWQLVTNLPENAPLAICGLYAVNESVVYASGSNYPYKRYPARVIKTTDGGKTWTVIEMGEHASNLIDIFFFDEKHGFVVGGYSDKEDPDPEKNVPDYSDVIPVVLYTEDGGITWDNRVANLEFEPGEWGWKINFVNKNVGYVSLESFNRAAVLKTTDGGKTWIRLPIDDPQGNANLEGVGFITEDRGWVGGWGSADFTAGYTSGTIDGGITWVDANQVGRFINRFRFIGDPVTVGYACGRRVYKYNPQGDIVPTLPQPTSTGLISPERMIKTFSLQRFENNVEFDIIIPERTQHVWLHIWNRFGAEVRLLLNEANPTPGARKLMWDGLDDSGQVVQPGIYIFRLTVDNTADSGNFYLERRV